MTAVPENKFLSDLTGAASENRLSAELLRELDIAVSDLPAAIDALNNGKSFSSRSRAVAVREFINLHALSDSGFDAVEFLRNFCADYPSRDGALVVFAAELTARKEYPEAIRVINDAMSLNQFDLYAQEVAEKLFEAVKDRSPTEAVDIYLDSHFCDEPFKHLETVPDGNVYLCCPGWMPVTVGNIHSAAAEEIWYGAAAQELRNSIIDGSYRYCSRMHCAKITSRRLVKRDEAVVENYIKEYEKDRNSFQLPTTVVLSHDLSCNLSCPSCRTKLILANKEEQKRLDSLVEFKLLPLLREAETVKVTGSGDPFGSNHFRRLLKRVNRTEFPRIKLFLHTNGQLFTENAWNDLELSDLVDIVQISVDSISPEIYKILRRGGELSRLVENLKFVKQLREAGQIRHLDLLMVVQALNFREIPEFAGFALENGADSITYQLLRNWGTYTLSEFNTHNIADSNHPDHQEFISILKDPRLLHPAVHLNDVAINSSLSN